ncbi:MAG TPA: TetR/AcrR family transcriptional regulator [Thermoleophilaceae bacterium]
MPVIVKATTDSRDRMVRSAAVLFRERGYSGTGFRDVIAHSGAPRGSIYHHFPGGKAELAEEAVRYAADVVLARLERAGEGGDAVAALRAYLDGWRRQLERTGFSAGCPIVAVAIEPHESPGVTEAVAEAFARWEDLLARLLRDSGIGRARAARLASTIVAAVEGAIVLCRARRDTMPLDDVGRELEAAIRSAQDR